MREDKTRTIQKEIEEVIGYSVSCDKCKKVILTRDLTKIPGWTPNGVHAKEIGYYEVTTGHHDWGNDSIDSIKTHDICCDCINSFVSEYLKNSDDEYGVHHSCYIDINHHWDRI